MAHPFSNLIVESLPPALQAEFKSRLEFVPLPVNTILFEAEQTPRFVYFLTSGAASVVTPLSGGDAIEVGLIGREGIPGAVLLLGKQFGANRGFMQVQGTAGRMDFRLFQQLLRQHPEIQRLVLQYVQCEFYVTTQLAACNRAHEVEERLARWLLMLEDRLGESQLPLTQEFLAEMIGARRSTVTVAAGALQRAGLIRYRRGHIEILERKLLEEVACECYPTIASYFRELPRALARPTHDGAGGTQKEAAASTRNDHASTTSPAAHDSRPQGPSGT